MWPKPGRKKVKGTKSKLKAVKGDSAESSESSDRKSGRSDRRKTRPPNRNRRQRTGSESDKSQKNKSGSDSAVENESSSAASAADADGTQETASKVDREEESNVWKDRILKAYKGSPRDSAQLLAIVPNQRAQFEAGERQKQELIEESMIKIVDRMFDNFQNTAYGFNQVTQGSDLELTWIRPSLTTEAQGNWVDGAAEGIRVFTGRISTRYWTLVVRGTANSISSYILPSDKLLSFGTSALDYDPYAELFPRSDGMAVTWHIKEFEIAQDTFPGVFRALLDGLIRFANEEAEPDECFRLEDIGLVPEPEEAPVEEVSPPHLEEGEPELLGQKEEKAPPQKPQHPGQHSIEQAIDRALAGSDEEEFEEEEPDDEDEEEEEEGIVDPGAGFIESVSSQVAYEATQEMDLIRESMKHQTAAAAEEEPESMETGQWKMISSDLPPAVASQWQNYVKNTGEQTGSSQEATGGEQSTSETEEDKWNVVPDTDNLAVPRSSAPGQGPSPGMAPGQGMSPQTFRESMQHQDPRMEPAQQIPGQGPGPGVPYDYNQQFHQEDEPMPGQGPAGWVHPSQMQGQAPEYAPQVYQNAPQYPHPGQSPQVPSPSTPHNSPGLPGPSRPSVESDDEETIEFQSPTGHSHYLLTEDDIDDRAIQTPPPDPDAHPGGYIQQPQPQGYPPVEEGDEQQVEYEQSEESEEYEEEETIQYQVEEADLPGVLAAVVNTIDMKVENLSQKGAQAFSVKDFKRAEMIIKLSERLNEFKEEANQLLSLLDEEE